LMGSYLSALLDFPLPNSKLDMVATLLHRNERKQ
jgi:hypothetical protein